MTFAAAGGAAINVTAVLERLELSRCAFDGPVFHERVPAESVAVAGATLGNATAAQPGGGSLSIGAAPSTASSSTRAVQVRVDSRTANASATEGPRVSLSAATEGPRVSLSAVTNGVVSLTADGATLADVIVVSTAAALVQLRGTSVTGSVLVHQGSFDGPRTHRQLGRRRRGGGCRHSLRPGRGATRSQVDVYAYLWGASFPASSTRPSVACR